MRLLDVMRSVGAMFANVLKGKENFEPKCNIATLHEVIERVDPVRLMSRDARYIAKLYRLNVEHREVINALSNIKELGSVAINDDLLSGDRMFVLVVHLRAVHIDDCYCTCSRHGYDLLYIRELMM